MLLRRTTAHGLGGFVLGLSVASGLALAGAPVLDAVAAHLTNARQASYDLDHLATQVQDRELRTQLRQATRRLDAELGALEGLVLATQTRPPAPPPEPVVYVTGPEDFAAIHAAVSDAPFEDGKLQILADAAVGRWFTVAQVITLIDAFPFSNGKVTAAASLYPQVVDPENWFQVYGKLTFDSDKQELRRRVGR